MQDQSIEVYAAKGKRVLRAPDEKVKKAIGHWSQVAQWPKWFAKNVVLWRKAHGLYWESCR